MGISVKVMFHQDRRQVLPVPSKTHVGSVYFSLLGFREGITRFVHYDKIDELKSSLVKGFFTMIRLMNRNLV